ASIDSMSSRAAENQQLVRTLLTNYYPGVLNGASEVRHIAFVLDANDAYVTSSATNDDVAPAIASSRAAGAAGGFVAVGGSGAGAITFDTVRAAAVRSPSDSVRAGAVRATLGPLNLSRYGLGTIDRGLIRATSMSSYRAGVMSPNGLDVYIVRL